MYLRKLAGTHGFRTLLIISAVSAFASPALASPSFMTISDDGQGNRSARVSYSDLDLASFDGQRELKQRIDSAASRVCRSPNEYPSVTRACRKAARIKAQPQLFAAIQNAQVRLAMVSPSR